MLEVLRFIIAVSLISVKAFGGVIRARARAVWIFSVSNSASPITVDTQVNISKPASMDGEGVGVVGSSSRVATGGAMMVIEAIKGPGG
jgi:hypothetical protein